MDAIVTVKYAIKAFLARSDEAAEQRKINEVQAKDWRGSLNDAAAEFAER